jgi:hypothetical protein
MLAKVSLRRQMIGTVRKLLKKKSSRRIAESLKAARRVDVVGL